MDDGLVHMERSYRLHRCLNPCCSGRWSSTSRTLTPRIGEDAVLILVVVDDGLVLLQKAFLSILCSVLILVVVDDGLVLDLIRHY